MDLYFDNSECGPGFYWFRNFAFEDFCYQCPLGTYKDYYGQPVQCTSCPVGHTTFQTGSTSISQCGKFQSFSKDLLVNFGFHRFT